MNSRALRFALATLAVAAIIGAAYLLWKEESQARTAAAAARNFEARVRLISRSLLDIKGAQPGYVAAGQGDDFWTAKIDALTGSTREALSGLRSQARAVQAQNDIDTAAAAFEDFEQMDRRARNYASNGQRLLASDLVFSDGIEIMDAALAALDRAREIESSTQQTAVEERRRTELIAAAATAAIVVAVVLLLTPLPGATATMAVPKSAAVEPAADLPIAPAPAATVPAAPPPPLIVPQAPPAPARSIDLQAMASLCTDLGRVLDTRALPAALERAAALLDASGIVIWIADPDGRELAPIIAHGYAPNLVARLGTIERDAENVTAAAFRTGVVQTVKGDAVSHGAVAAPLLTPIGPVGVMAAEVLHEGERHETTRAAAAIIAAQLATLMGPPSSRPQGKAEAAGA